MATLFRIVRAIPPTAEDFKSYEELGVEPMRPLGIDESRWWRGISTFDSLEAARLQARRRRGLLGTFIAILDVPDSLEVEQTGSNRSHFTLWGGPDALLAIVRDTVPVNE